MKALALSREDGIAVPGYYGYFDGLRAILAFAVFISHAHILPTALGDLGIYAVRVFFALSGFLVGGILIDRASESGFWRSTPRFYFNRCCRIWVPYLIMLGAYCGLMLLRGYWDGEFSLRLVPLLTYTHNWANVAWGLSDTTTPINHAWSLAIEEQFYLICPLLAGVVRSRAILIGLMLSFYTVLPLLGAEHFSAISLGVAAAALQREVGASTWREIQKASLAFGVPLISIMLATGVSHQHPAVPYAAILVVIGCSFDLPKKPLFHLLGAMSYSFYLFHWMGYYIANPLAKRLPEAAQAPVHILVALAISLAISYASVRLIEWPMLAHRDRLARRYPTLPKVATATAFGLTLTGVLFIVALS